MVNRRISIQSFQGNNKKPIPILAKIRHFKGAKSGSELGIDIDN